MFAAIFLIGSFLLLRRSPPASSSGNLAEMDKKLSELDRQVEALKVEAEMKAMFDQWEAKRRESKQS
jgi:hypothetical protein